MFLFLKFFSMSMYNRDKHINDKCGKDAIYYLFFQRYLIVFMLVITILSVSILLPINLNGNACKLTKKKSKVPVIKVDFILIFF